MRRKYKKGAITIIFLAVVALVLTMLLAATQSRLLLSLRRSQSTSDILIATYKAESEANDIMARLLGGYLEDANIPKTVKSVGDIRIEIEGQDLGETQIVTVTAFRGLAVGKVQAVRRVLSVAEVDEVEMVLVLDCTTSMNSSSGLPGQTRFEAQEGAATDFIDAISDLPDADKFKVGVAVFGSTSAWLQYNGTDITPGSFNFFEIADALESGFGSSRVASQCGSTVADFTSVGTAFRHGHDYFAGSAQEGVKQIEIVITDGVPNARASDPQCLPSISCVNCEPEAKDYLRCALAESGTFVTEIGQNGVRDSEVDAYAVTIFNEPPADVVTIFQKYATEGGYFNANQASELSGILDGILGRILEDRSTVTIKRVIPTPQ